MCQLLGGRPSGPRLQAVPCLRSRLSPVLVLPEVSPNNRQQFGKRLLEWGTTNFRRFPWRESGNTYCIFVAELLLHRTRADQVAAIYPGFISRFPNMLALAEGTESEISDILWSLGLRWRISLIKAAAVKIVQDFGGSIPRDREGLTSLPGVGDYAASATLCFALEAPEPILDSNTVRVICRAFGIPVNDSLRRRSDFRVFAKSLVDLTHPPRYNYALLDLADSVCLARTKPRCSICPLSGLCSAIQGQP